MKAMKYIERPAELLEAAAKEAGENVEAYYSKHISFMEGCELVAKIESKIDGVYRLSITPKEKRNMNTKAKKPETFNADEFKQRIRSHVERELAKPFYSTRHIVPKNIVEGIIGQPVEDAITEIVCRKNGVGVANPSPEQALMLDETKSAAEWGTLARNNRERDQVRMAAHSFLELTFPADLFTGDELCSFLKRFYRAGDTSLHAAQHRALKECVERMVA